MEGIKKEFRRGDIFDWEYKSEIAVRHYKYHGSYETLYWCKARRAEIDGTGQLRDLYWSDKGYLDLDRVVLTYLGNIYDCYEVPRHEKYKYKEEDCIDLQNQNKRYDTVFIKNWAIEQSDLILNKLNKDLEMAKQKADYWKREVLSLCDKIEKIKKND